MSEFFANIARAQRNARALAAARVRLSEITRFATNGAMDGGNHPISRVRESMNRFISDVHLQAFSEGRRCAAENPLTGMCEAERAPCAAL
jgi:hypothetical protein